MQLSLLVALVAAIVVSENAPHEPVAAGRLRLLPGLGRWTGGDSVCGQSGSPRHCAGHRRRPGPPPDVAPHVYATQAGPSGRLAGCRRYHVFALDWPQLVRYNWGLDHAILVKDLLILAPIWLPLMLSWTAFYEVELAIHRALHVQERRCRSDLVPVRVAEQLCLDARAPLSRAGDSARAGAARFPGRDVPRRTSVGAVPRRMDRLSGAVAGPDDRLSAPFEPDLEDGAAARRARCAIGWPI